MGFPHISLAIKNRCHKIESDRRRREGGYDKDSSKHSGTAERLEHQLPHRKPKPQDSLRSNRKHLFRSDNSTKISLRSISVRYKRNREESAEGRKARTSEGKAEKKHACVVLFRGRHKQKQKKSE